MKPKLLQSNLIIFSLLLFCLTCFHSFGQTKKISMQGFLKDANGKAIADDKQFKITFKLYTTAIGGTVAWSEEQTLNISGGVYSTQLGQTVSLENLNWGTSTYYVGVNIGTTELSPRTELTFAPYSLGSPRATLADTANVVKCSGAIGDVKYSILNPTQFAGVNGPCWVPMDGSSMAGSKLATILNSTTLPDIGGAFVRSQEFAGKADRDPERTSSTTIATLQDDVMKLHTHDLSPGTIGGGAHNHFFLLRLLSGGTKINQVNKNVPYEIFNGVTLLNNTMSNGSIKFAAEDYIGDNLPSDPNKSDVTFNTNNAGTGGSSHSHTLSGNTGNNSGTTATETRPKNLNLWTYIRIN